MMFSFGRKKQHSATLDQFEAAEYSLICAHWKGSPCIVKVRELSDVQIQACGNFSLIETDKYKWSKTDSKNRRQPECWYLDPCNLETKQTLRQRVPN